MTGVSNLLFTVFFLIWAVVVVRIVRRVIGSGKKDAAPEKKAKRHVIWESPAPQENPYRPDVYAQSDLPQNFMKNNRKDMMRALDENRSNDWLAKQMRDEALASRRNGLDLGGPHESGMCAADWLKESHQMWEHDDSIDDGELDT
jgi:hypothetical protein